VEGAKALVAGSGLLERHLLADKVDDGDAALDLSGNACRRGGGLLFPMSDPGPADMPIAVSSLDRPVDTALPEITIPHPLDKGLDTRRRWALTRS